MKRKLFVASVVAAAAMGITVKRGGAQMMSGMMDEGDVAAQADMGTVMALFANHTMIRRRVEPIPGGIRAITESDDPRVAGLLQAHVATMYRRVDDGRRFTMMSRTLPAMFANARRYRRVLSLTPHGVAVVESSSDDAVAAVIRAHAREVSGFVTDGMRSMMRNMMGS
jgi:hypothetical protein